MSDKVGEKSPESGDQDTSIARVNSSLGRALESYRISTERISRLASGNLTKNLAFLQTAAFADQMNRTIGSASFVRSAQLMQKALGSQSSAISEGLLKTAGLNMATQMQSQAMRAIRANSASIALSSSAAMRALKSTGLSQSIAQTLTPLFTNRVSTIMERFAKDFEDLSRRIREQAERGIRFSQVMMDLGWPPPVDLPMALVNKLLQLVDDRGLEDAAPDIEKEICAYYTPERLRRKVRAWGKTRLLGRRKRILEKAVKAHIDGDYELSVPAMVAQVEGVIADGFGHVGRMNGKQYHKYLDSHFQAPGDSGVEDAANQAVRAFVAKVLLAQFEHGKPSQSQLSRHAILHGGDTDYPKEENSLKAILILDVLQDSFGFVTLDGSDVFHRDGCPAVMSSKKPVHHHKDADMLVAQGKRPCKRCNPV